MMKSDEYYDKIWEAGQDDMKKYGPFSRHCRRIIKDVIRGLPFNTVLDVGCGQGSLLLELCADFPHIRPSGIDISTSAIKSARQKVPNGRFWDIDIVRECLDERFDLVICSEVLEHISEDMAALNSLYQMTGKFLVISTVQGRMRRFETEKIGHVRNYAPGELVGKIQSSGFAVIDVIEWGFPFYSPLYRNLLELTGVRGTTGEFGLIRRVISNAIHYLFMLNSSKRGDEIFVLAEPARGADRPGG